MTMFSGKALFVAATEFEVSRLRTSTHPVLVTGIGAVNAAAALARYLATHERPLVVIQCGVAGAFRSERRALPAQSRLLSA